MCCGSLVGADLMDPEGWPLHVIDDSSRGADGVRLDDVNGDGWADVAVGWEEGNVSRVYLHPGSERVRDAWPQVTVGETVAVEDLVCTDLDGDGAWDAVSSCEGKTRALSIHWAPSEPGDYLKADHWTTEELPAARALKQMWMFAVPAQLDGKHGVDLIAGSKGKAGTAVIGWFEAPEVARELERWRWHPLREASWIMGMEAVDMDADGDTDVVFSERYHGERSGCYWLENPGLEALNSEWAEHAIGLVGKDALFFCREDVDGDGLEDICVGTQSAKGSGGTEGLYWIRRLDASGLRWDEHPVPLPKNVGEFKAVSAGDVDLNGTVDLVVDFNFASEKKPAVIWLSNDGNPVSGRWKPMPLSGPKGGVKTDLCPLVDLDGDGDLDVMTTEERKGLGVIWYENPLR